jgi:GDPmannose 4,6-dehydratase
VGHPAETFDVNTGGLARILKIIERLKRDTRIYQASSSEMFGNHNGPCSEVTPLQPMSPYGVSKAAAHRLVALYRERGLFVVSGMLFNHESPRRGTEMVTRKITRHVAGWAAGDMSMLHLGNMESRRDWGFAGDYVRAMHAMLQQEEAVDYVIGTGVSHSVMEFLQAACIVAGVDWGFARSHIHMDECFLRTQEIYNLVADAKKANAMLGWHVEVGFPELVKLMVEAEAKSAKGSALLAFEDVL